MKLLTQELYSKLEIKISLCKSLVNIIIGIIMSRDVCLRNIANNISGNAIIESKIRQIQRVLAKEISIISFISLIMSWFNVCEIILSIDRTNWKFGKHNINILMIGIVTPRLVIPLCWHLMKKRGNSNQIERIMLMERILSKIEQGKIKGIVGDREFIGKDWFQWLSDNKIPFCIRIKENQHVTYKGKIIKSGKLFNNIRSNNLGEVELQGIKVNLSGCELEREKLILVSQDIKNPVEMYKKRWGIETLFQNLKGRGFNIENTHITDLRRFNSLLVCVCIAMIWCYKVGDFTAKIKPISIKNHGRPAYSIFRYGLNEIQNMLYSAIKIPIICLKNMTSTLINPLSA